MPLGREIGVMQAPVSLKSSLGPSDFRFEIEGQTVNVRSIRDAIDKIIDRLKRPGSFLIFTLNTDHLVKLRTNPEFHQAYARAELVTADGFPLVMLARMEGHEVERTTGSDLIEPLCRKAAERHLPVFLFGTSLDALCKAGRALSRRVRGLEIGGAYSPPLGFSADSVSWREGMDVIARSGARICFVALSPPLQEVFAAQALAGVEGVAFICVGAGLDFIAGKQVRCPTILQRLNLEWAWRVCLNPSRLAGRYVRCALLLGEIVPKKVFAKLRGRRAV